MITISSSSSSSSLPSWDVFLSFRGEDCRSNFISHLYFALDQAGIQTFRDEPALEKGQEISSALLNAIEDSKMFVVVLSENYAQSSWCLDELVHILSSKTTENQVIPVFYHVDPSDVRRLQKNYGTAFEKHEKRYADGVIREWKSALAEISNISGYHLGKEANKDESELVQDIVRRVASQAFIKQLHLEEHLYGIESAVQEIYQKLRMEELNDVRVIGICGMGGIGKTTTAKAFYNQYSNRFDISCFIEDVKQYSQGGSPQLQLLRQLLSKLRRRRDYEVSDVETGIRQLQYVLRSNKALIILDDLDKLSHLEGLDRLCFSLGSRLVITTRDVNLLNQLKVDLSELEIYMVKKLEHKDSLELFSYHAFRKPMPPDDFKELSVRFVTYAEGLPLALKVLGASLRGRTDISFWKAKYKTLEKIPKNEIHKILRLSYDDELVHILASKKTQNQVIPVFYYVDPSDVRHLKNNYETAFRKHEERYAVGVIDKWKSALFEISNVSGYHLRKEVNQNESDIVQEIVQHVALPVSTKLTHLEEYLVGTDSAVEEIYQKVQMESNVVRVIGICGMGGIGKTTTAKAFYNKYSNRFDISCFIENEKQYSQDRNPLLHLLQQLLKRKSYKFSGAITGIEQLQKILYSKNALVILDGLDQSSHLEWLERFCKMFSSRSRSRIVITTKNVNLLDRLKVDTAGVEIHMVKKLDKVDSLKLFSYHAFRKLVPSHNFRKLSLSFVTYAGGHPLALKVLGASLLGKTDMLFWKAKHEKIQEIPENDIHRILRWGYDELADETEKTIFLDIVFFFVGKNKAEAIHIFESCHLFPNVGIPNLVDKFLLTIDEDNNFQMHNLIQDMGRKVIGEESKHGNCRRLYMCQRNQWQTLTNLEGTYTIEGLVIDMTSWPQRQLSANIFERMPNLRLLEIIGTHHIEGSFVNSFHELRYIRWHHYPWTQLPSTFRPQKLVFLDMPFSNLRMIWEDAAHFPGLKTINMSHSQNLKRTPDFRDLKMMEKMFFRGCKRLKIVHPSIGQLINLCHLDVGGCNDVKKLPDTIGQLTKLGHMELGGCVNLTRLPENIKQLTNLSSLDLADCWNLKRLPEQLGDMKGLKMIDASFTAIEQLPDSIGQLKELVSLRLYRCIKLRKLPEQFGNMEGLMRFDATYSGIEELPDSTGQLINLVELRLFGCNNLASLPDSLQELKLLQYLDLSYCSNLERLPEKLGNMQSLQHINASDTAIQEIPDSIGHLSRLRNLDLGYSKKLKHVPNSIWNLTSLQTLCLEEGDIFTSNLADAVTDMENLKTLKLKCNIGLWLPTILSFTSLEELDLAGEGKSLSPPEYSSLWELSKLKTLKLDNWGSSYLELPLNLRKLELCNNATVEQLPDLSDLEQLTKLDISNCISLQSLPPLPPNLVSLFVYECTSLKDVPDLSMLEELQSSLFLSCSNLKSPEVRPPDSLLYIASLPNKEIPEWFDFKSSGSTVSFNIPSSVLDDNFLGIAIWVVYRYKHPNFFSFLEAVITNTAEGMEENCSFYMHEGVDEEVQQSRVQCISKDGTSMKSGDRIEIAFQTTFPDEVEMCGAHIIQKTQEWFDYDYDTS